MSGLNCGRWDYMFSMVKKFRNHRDYMFPDRTLITMTVPFMRAYCLNVIKVCHRHGAYAMGGMAAQIPIKNNLAANDAALAKVRADKEREATDGHDGTWVAHPGLVQTALDAFAGKMKGPNQLSVTHDMKITADDMPSAPLHLARSRKRACAGTCTRRRPLPRGLAGRLRRRAPSTT